MNKAFESSKLDKVEKLLCSLLFLVTGLFIYSCFDRSINVDDGWLGEPAMWFARDGYIHSAALRGWENAETHLFFTHKLLVALGALFVKIFGYSVYSLKAVSAFYLFLLVGSWVYFFRDRNFSAKHTLVFLVLLLMNSLVFEYAFIFRPEVALAFYASWVYFILSKDNPKDRWQPTILAGLIAAIAIGHHLNAVIISGAGCVLLLTQKRFKHFFVFGCVATLGFLFYFFDVRSVADVQTMFAQFGNTQDMRGEKSVAHYLFNLLDEQRRFLHSPREISLTLLLIVSLFVGRKYLRTSYFSALIFLGSMVALLALIAHGKTSKYLILYMPLILFLVTAVILEKWQKHKKTFVVLLALYAGSQIPSDIGISFEKNNLDTVLTDMVGDLPYGSKILGPMEAVFWAWDKYDLQAVEVYEIYNLRGSLEFKEEVLQDQLHKFGTEAILFRGYMRTNFGALGPKYGPFTLVRESPDGLLSYYLKK